MPSPVQECLCRESPDHIPEGIERSSSWCSSADSGYGSGSQDDGTHSASSRSTVQLGSAAWSPLRTRSAAVVQQTLTPTRNGSPCPAEAGGSTRSKRRLMLQESQDSDTRRAWSKRRFLDDDSTGALRTAGTGGGPPPAYLHARPRALAASQTTSLSSRTSICLPASLLTINHPRERIVGCPFACLAPHDPISTHWVQHLLCLTPLPSSAAPITPVPELASRLLLVDRPSAPSAASSSKIDAAVERGWKGPHMPSVESKVRSMLVEEQDVSR
jgi:hypothetical protein